MANRLEMAMIQAIQQLHAAGLSRRAIARTLGVHRDTVARVLRQSQPEPEPASAPSGSERPKPATFPGAPAQGIEGAPVTEGAGHDSGPAAASKPASAPSGSDVGMRITSDTIPPPARTASPPAPSGSQGGAIHLVIIHKSLFGNKLRQQQS